MISNLIVRLIDFQYTFLVYTKMTLTNVFISVKIKLMCKGISSRHKQKYILSHSDLPCYETPYAPSFTGYC